MSEQTTQVIPPPMGDWERLAHYALGLMNGAVPNESARTARLWEEYRRLGGDPSADPWPVESLGTTVTDEVLEQSRALREVLAQHMREHGVTVDASRVDKALAALIGEEPFQSRETWPEHRAEREPEVEAGETCARCEALDGVTVKLTTVEGRPYCQRCGTDGSGAQL